MHVTFALFADAANLSQEGKLNILGVLVGAVGIITMAAQLIGRQALTRLALAHGYDTGFWWIAGIFALIPALSPLSIIGIYGLYLLYLGLPMLMKAPAAKATSYTITVEPRKIAPMVK